MATEVVSANLPATASPLSGVGNMFSGFLSFIVSAAFYIVIIVLVVVIVYLIWLYLKKQQEVLFFPRKDFYEAELFALKLTPMPLLKDLHLTGGGEMTPVRLGKIVSAKIEENDNVAGNPLAVQELKDIGADSVVSFLVKFDAGLMGKISPKIKIVKVFRRLIENDILLGDILIKGTGLKPLGFYLTVHEKGSNSDKLMLKYLGYNAMLTAYEKAQDKWGQFALSNVGQKEAYIAAKERDKMEVKLPFFGNKDKK